MTDTKIPSEMIEQMREHLAQQRSLYGYDTPSDEFPQPLTLEEMKAGELRNALKVIDRVIARHSGKQDLGPDQWTDLWFHTGPVHDRDLPRFALTTLAANCWTYEGAREVVERAWTLPEWPGQYGRDNWLMAFARTDFICSEREAGKDCLYHEDEWDFEGDGEPLVLYRGSLTSTKRGLSWTLDLERAQWFAARGDMSGKGRQMSVWRCEVPRDRTLAHFGNRSEAEVVADVRGLRIVRVK